MTFRAFSFGGGVQSTAALVLAARHEINYQTFIFVNVGDDSEHPDTLQYVREVALPFAAQYRLEIHELQRRRRDGSVETLYSRLMKPGSRSLTIPVRMSRGVPAKRNCTSDFKIRVIAKWLKQQGATAEQPAISGLGISIDEIRRMRTDSRIPWQLLDYPLIELRLRRSDCVRIIESAGLPVPNKSSCWFCPYHGKAGWMDLKRRHPDLFERAADLETHLRTGSLERGQGPVYMTDAMRPLRDVFQGTQTAMFEDATDNCESGYCLT